MFWCLLGGDLPLYFLGVMILLLNDVHFGEYRIALNGDFVMNATYDDAHDGALTGDAMTLLCLRRGDLNGEQCFSCTVSVFTTNFNSAALNKYKDHDPCIY